MSKNHLLDWLGVWLLFSLLLVESIMPQIENNFNNKASLKNWHRILKLSGKKSVWTKFKISSKQYKLFSSNFFICKQDNSLNACFIALLLYFLHSSVAFSWDRGLTFLLLFFICILVWGGDKISSEVIDVSVLCVGCEYSRIWCIWFVKE